MINLPSSKKAFALLAIALPLIILSGCGPRYKAKQLTPLTHTQPEFKETKNNITLAAKKLNKEEADELFDGRSNILFNKKRPVYPIQCSVNNGSNQTIRISKDDISLPLIGPYRASQILRTSTGLCILGPLCGGILALPVITYLAAIGLSLTQTYTCPCCIFIPALAIAGGIYLIGAPSLAYALGSASSKANTAINHDLNEKMLNDCLVISPGQKKDFMLLAQGSKYQPNFTMTVANEIKEKTIFAVSL